MSDVRGLAVTAPFGCSTQSQLPAPFLETAERVVAAAIAVNGTRK
jgi:hypothetical protein